jgi:hypothetical protein
VQARLWPAPQPFADGPTFREFVGKIIFRQHLDRLPPELGARLLDELTAECARDQPPFVADYWRLDLDARRP